MPRTGREPLCSQLLWRRHRMNIPPQVAAARHVDTSPESGSNSREDLKSILGRVECTGNRNPRGCGRDVYTLEKIRTDLSVSLLSWRGSVGLWISGLDLRPFRRRIPANVAERKIKIRRSGHILSKQIGNNWIWSLRKWRERESLPGWLGLCLGTTEIVIYFDHCHALPPPHVAKREFW